MVTAALAVLVVTAALAVLVVLVVLVPKAVPVALVVPERLVVLVVPERLVVPVALGPRAARVARAAAAAYLPESTSDALVAALDGVATGLESDEEMEAEEAEASPRRTPPRPKNLAPAEIPESRPCMSFENPSRMWPC